MPDQHSQHLLRHIPCTPHGTQRRKQPHQGTVRVGLGCLYPAPAITGTRPVSSQTSPVSIQF
nr:hypothetical protein RVX_2085 [Nitratidesulfovibrio sp. HK-II]